MLCFPDVWSTGKAWPMAARQQNKQQKMAQKAEDQEKPSQRGWTFTPRANDRRLLQRMILGRSPFPSTGIEGKEEITFGGLV